MGDLVCVRIFFPQTSGDRILFPDIQRCKIFSLALNAMKDIFSVCRI